MIMVSNHAFLLILVLWSSVKVSGILKPVHDNEIYFEVIEPGTENMIESPIFGLDAFRFALFLLAEISYTFRGRLAGNFGSDFVSNQASLHRCSLLAQYVCLVRLLSYI